MSTKKELTPATASEHPRICVKCGHTEIQHMHFSDHDECSGDECECNRFFPRKPDSASTGKDAKTKLEQIRDLLAEVWQEGYEAGKSATPSGGVTQQQIHSLANLLVADSTSLNFTQLQSYEAKVQRWESVISERVISTPFGGGEKWWYEQTADGDWSIGVGNRGFALVHDDFTAKSIADAHNATLQPQDDTKRLDWLALNIINGIASIKVDKAFTHSTLENPLSLPELLREAIDAAMRKEA